MEKKEKIFYNHSNNSESKILSENIYSLINNSICIIKKDNIKGLGTLCKVQIPHEHNLLPTLIINTYFFNKINNENNIINIIYNGKEIKIKVKSPRKFFIFKNLKICIIEIKPNKDKIKLKDFLEIDNDNYKDKTYLYNYYPKYCIYKLKKNKKTLLMPYNFINHINSNFNYYILPILSLNNLKVIGIQNIKDKFLFNKDICFKYFTNQKLSNILILTYICIIDKIKLFGDKFFNKNKKNLKMIIAND